MTKETKRTVVEKILQKKFAEVKPFTPKKASKVEKYKDGSFGVGVLAFALYSNGHNFRGRSIKNPFGLLFDDGEAIFSIGYYRKEHDAEDEDGFLFVVAPRGKKVVEKVEKFVDKVLEDKEIPCQGVYVRFLSLSQYVGLINKGFLPAKESPWDPESPEEDETFTYSRLNVSDLLEIEKHGVVKVKSIKGQSGSGKKRIKASYSRFVNFLERNGFTFTLREYTPSKLTDAKYILYKHFEMLEKLNKAVGSTPEDHFNSIDPEILKLEKVKAYIGYLNGQPVSLFVGEFLSKKSFGLYTPFTLRDSAEILPLLKLRVKSKEAVGFTALSTYAYVELIKKLMKKGVEEINFGGSEITDLNIFKRKLGCRSDPTYWVVKLSV